MAEKNQAEIQKRNGASLAKVLFYVSSARNFRSSWLGYFYEISQAYPTVLLSEELDSETKEILRDKNLFPKLEKIIPIHQYGGKKMNLLASHRYFCKMAGNLIRQYQPDIVIANGANFFESYLRRFAKRIHAINVCFAEFAFGGTKQYTKEYILRIAHLKAPSFLPLFCKILFSKLRMYFGHFLCYWILPLMIGQKPFTKEMSRILIANNSRHGSIDYFIVFLKQDYNLLKDGGIPTEKLYMLLHPFGPKRRVGNFFGDGHCSATAKKNEFNTKILTIMWPPEPVAFRRDNYSLVSEEEKQKSGLETAALIVKMLKGWKVFIKPHPVTKNTAELVRIFKSISNQIEVVEPTEPADKYIEMSDVLVGFFSASTTLLNAFRQRPEKPILSLDFHHVYCGDWYKDSEGIEYIDNKEKFINILELIRDDKYYKKPETKSEIKSFSSTVELLEHLLRKKLC